ncbi:HAD family hydrolase [Niallia sp. FSL W8-0635]|uniref:HAD family hydrolase n=1 Tax=Niallia sp. FSL W8-0635 TaxID=2975337 RepID=UPI0030FC6157
MIFFDIDGTLLDHDYAERQGILDFLRTNPSLASFTEQQIIETWKELSRKYFEEFLMNKLSFQDQKRARMIELFEMVGVNLTNEEADDKFKNYLSFYKENWIAYPDVMEVLEKLKVLGYPLGVISNGDYQQQVEKLQRIGVEKFINCVITSSEVGVSKPDSTIFIKACELTNSSIEKCYYVGDRLEIDALGSQVAGMNGIWLNRSGGKECREVTVIGSLGNLLNLLENDLEEV